MRLFLRSKKQISLPPVPKAMEFAELCLALDAFENNVLSSEVPLEKVPEVNRTFRRLGDWITDNWGVKRDTLIPNSIQGEYDKMVDEFKHHLAISRQPK